MASFDLTNPAGNQFGLDSLIALGNIQNQQGQLKLAKATQKAQASYQKKSLELQGKGLGLQADQIAKQYAVEMAKLEWDKESFRLEFGETKFQNEWERGFREKESQLDDAYRRGAATGFIDGLPTLESLQLQQQNQQFGRSLAEQGRQFDLTTAEGQRQFDAAQAQQESQFGRTFGEGQLEFGKTFGEGQRQFNQTFGEGQRQFNVGATGYMNVTRPLSIAQQNRLNILESYERAGRLDPNNGPDAAGLVELQALRDYQSGVGNQQATLAREQFGENQRQFNVGTVMNAPRGPADWAAYTARMRGLQGAGSLPGMFTGAPVASYSNGRQDTGHVLTNTELAMGLTGQGNQQQLQGTPWGGPPRSGGEPASYSTGSSNPYSADGSPPAGGGLPSLQKFRRYAPTEQQMGLGQLAESGGPTEEDANYLMQRQGPGFSRSKSARFMGI